MPEGQAEWDMQRLTLSVDDDLAAALDQHAKERLYASRSEALRDLLRELQSHQRLSAAEKRGKGHCIATLAYVYDHETRNLGSRLTREQHRHHDLQVATLHVHLDHESCLEVSVLRGSSKAVQAFADDTISQRGVRHGKLHIIPAERIVGQHSHGSGPHEHFHA
jgi:CopG family transcriptional regulator, nickel-responsive regulator